MLAQRDQWSIIKKTQNPRPASIDSSQRTGYNRPLYLKKKIGPGPYMRFTNIQISQIVTLNCYFLIMGKKYKTVLTLVGSYVQLGGIIFYVFSL